MDSFNNITHTTNGTLVKIVHPVRSGSGQLAGYMCEHPKGWRTFVALQDLKITDEMKKDIEKIVPAPPPDEPKRIFVTTSKPTVPVAQPAQPKKEEVKETPAPVVPQEEPAATTTMSNPIIVEIPLGSVMEDTTKVESKPAPAAVAEAPKRKPGRPPKTPAPSPVAAATADATAPVADAPKKRTRRTKAQMEEARKAGLAPAKKVAATKDAGKKPGRKPGRKPGPKPGPKPGRKPGRPAAAKPGRKPGRPAAAKATKEVKHRVRRTKEQIAAGVTHEEAARLAAKK